jgi:hypothetical protein
MRARTLWAVTACLGLAGIFTGYGLADEAEADWAMNATIIEACSCPMFCSCYFNPEPSSHHGEQGAEHFCRFNNAFQVNSGHHGEVDLAGARFWIGGDLGAEFDDGRMDWARLHFDPAVTPAQRAGIAAVVAHVYPVEWDDFAVGEDAVMVWEADADRAVARLGDGQAEVVLNRFPGNTDDPVVIHNLKYWGVPRHDGFVLMPNEVEAYRVGEKAFEYAGGNGFMITFDITSADVAAAAAAAEAP